MSSFISFMTSDKVKGVIALIAAVVMYFTPDNIDAIIEMLLGAFGITCLIISEKK